MSGLLKIVLLIIIIYYIYQWLKPKSFNSKENNLSEKEVKILKTKEIEKSKYNIEAETVEFEEIKQDEKETK